MRLLDLTLPTPEENLALDEALLDEAEAGSLTEEVLRLWESPEPFVVVGRSSHVADEVNRDECRRRGLRVLRRASGGAAVVAGPGCLTYALVLSQIARPSLAMISEAHRLVMGTMVSALQPLVPGIVFRGTCDLAVGDCKVSGNSLRVKRSHLLYHGTVLVDFPLDVVEACLKTPPRQPEYRRGRPHKQFVSNLAVETGELRAVLIEAWQAAEPLGDWPRSRVRDLVATKYGLDSWNLRL